MKINFKSGNILDTHEGIILHGCNAQRVMGAGLAKQIVNQYPHFYTDYLVHLDRCKENKINPLGTSCLTTIVNNKLYVVSGISQEYYGRDSTKVYASVKAIEQIFLDTINTADRLKIKNIHTVMLGCGLGNLDHGSFYMSLMRACTANKDKDININLYISS